MRQIVHRWHRRDFVGREVFDVTGRCIGAVADTWPHDGGGQPEMLLVKFGGFHLRRYVPLEGVEIDDENHLFLPYTYIEVDESPDAEDKRWGEPGYVARAYWTMAQDD